MNDVGWSRLEITQNYEDESLGITNRRKDELKNVSLNKLFSGLTIVQVRNYQQGSLIIGKQMQLGDTAIEGSDTFTMKVSLWSEDASGAKTPIAGTFGVRYVDADGAAIEGKAKELAFDEKGKATVALKPGERIVLGTDADGGARLKPNTKFSVSEINLPGGYSSPLITLNGESVEGDAATGTVGKASDPFRSGGFAETDNVSVVTVINRTLVLGLELLKVDADAPQIGLAGAEFEFRVDDGATGDDGKPVYNAATDIQATLYLSKESTEPITWSISTDGNGKLQVFGLQRGMTYWLVETKTPAGGYQLMNPIAFTVGNDGSLTFYDGRGIATATDGLVKITVENKKLVQVLPMTGGVGIVPFLLIGAAGIGTATYLVSQATSRKDRFGK